MRKVADPNPPNVAEPRIILSGSVIEPSRKAFSIKSVIGIRIQVKTIINIKLPSYSFAKYRYLSVCSCWQ